MNAPWPLAHNDRRSCQGRAPISALADNRKSANELHLGVARHKMPISKVESWSVVGDINVAVMIAAISLVSSGLFGAKMEDVIGYIGLGLIIWSAIAGLVADGCGLS